MNQNNPLPKPGIYRLTREIQNPAGDKRVSREFKRDPIWKTGMRLAIRPENLGDREQEFIRLKIYALNGYSHNGIFLDLPKRVLESSEEWDRKHVQQVALLLQPGVLELEPVSLESELMLQHYENFNSPILEQLVEDGKLTIADVMHALQNYLKKE